MNVKKIERLMDLFKTLSTILIAFAVTIVLIFLVSADPINTLKDFFLGPFSSVRRMGNIVEMTIPMLFTGAAVCIMFSINRFSLSLSSGYYIGGLMAGMMAYSMQLTAGIHPLVAMAVGALASVVVAIIPALLQVYFYIEEIISSLMLNYIIVYLGNYLLNKVMYDPAAGFPGSYPIKETAKLPIIISGTRIHFGLIIAILCLIFAYVLLYKTKWGYEMRTMGANPKFALYSGMGTMGVMLASQAIGGAVAGLGGASEVLGLYTRFQWTAAPSAGFDGIIVAILAGRNPALVPVAAVFLAYVRVGADIISRTSDVPFEIVSIIQAIIILMIGAEVLMSKMKHRQIVKASERSLAKEGEKA